MALPDYFHRSALAVAQVVQGFDEERLTALLGSTSIALSLGDVHTPEGAALADLSVRLLSRLYPRLSILAREQDAQERFATLALAINPAIAIEEKAADVGLAIGSDAPDGARHRIYLGSMGWKAFLSESDPQGIGDSDNPFGAGAAACLGAAALFRYLILGEERPPPGATEFSTWTCERNGADGPDVNGEVRDSVLVGGGAIGNAAAWALARTPLTGTLSLVDHETIELSNLQRYILATRADEHAAKVKLLASHFNRGLVASPIGASWQAFVAEAGYDWGLVGVALDSARDRRAVQASLPGAIVNAWTQPGDLGVSVHPHLDTGACLSCLYQPTGTVPNEDEIIAAALGLDHARFGAQIRQLLDAGAPPPRELLREAANHLGVNDDEIATFEGRPLRDLYVKGVCGGMLVPLSRLGLPDQELHVPLAHQSALAGVLLAAQFARMVARRGPDRTMVTRLNVMRPVPAHATQPAAKREDAVCICQDPVFRERYRQKYCGHDAPRFDSS